MSNKFLFSYFVGAAKLVFKEELTKINFKHGLLFPVNEEGDFVEPSLLSGSASSEESFQLRQEKYILRQEIQRLQVLLHEKETCCLRAEEEINHMQRRSQGVMEETKSLKTKVQLAEQAQRAALSMEQDYEDVVHMLEGEIAKLKTYQSVKVIEPSASSQQKLAVLMCQLKKSEASKRTYEVATEKLLQFTEHVHETMTGQGNSLALKPQGEPARGNKPPGYLGNHKKSTPKTLASEAKEVVHTVRNLIDAEPLPYGWEEAFTPDGVKYYVNHLTQTTSWTHPKSGVQQLAPSEDKKDQTKTL